MKNWEYCKRCFRAKGVNELTRSQTASGKNVIHCASCLKAIKREAKNRRLELAVYLDRLYGRRFFYLKK